MLIQQVKFNISEGRSGELDVFNIKTGSGISIISPIISRTMSLMPSYPNAGNELWSVAMLKNRILIHNFFTIAAYFFPVSLKTGENFE